MQCARARREAGGRRVAIGVAAALWCRAWSEAPVRRAGERPGTFAAVSACSSWLRSAASPFPPPRMRVYPIVALRYE